ANVTVDCGAKKSNSITAALGALNKHGPNTILITGTCNEALSIDGYDHLTLLGNPTATISDPTPSQSPEDEDTTVVLIFDSDRVVLQGITINGGATGIACQGFSVCWLQDVHVHGTFGIAVQFIRSSGFLFDDTVIEDNVGFGLSALSGSNVSLGPRNSNVAPTIQRNETGAFVGDNSHVQFTGSSVQDNSGVGIQVVRGSNVRVLGPVTGNGAEGVILVGSTARIAGATITGNTGNGVVVANLSYANFSGGNTINGNDTLDVNCSSTTAVTQGTGNANNLGGGGTTNCTEPAP
ncbi:MAG: right-handed parallel beta-helix repeat-containing protein, partial [Planctomycetota bacterium]